MIRLVSIFPLLFLAPAALADSISIEPVKAPVASVMTIRLTVELSPGEKALFPEKPALPEGAELISVNISDKVADGKNGPVKQSVEYTIESYKIGPAIIPGFEYSILDKNGAVYTRSTSPLSFEIVSVRAGSEDPEKLKNIKSPVHIPVRLSKYIMPALILIVILLAALLLWRWLKRRKREKPVPIAPPRPASEIAYEELNQLEIDDPFGKGFNQEHFYRLSEIVRSYLELRYGILALERTTIELKREFNSQFETNENRVRLYNLLEACDLVKFANQKSTRANADDSIVRARELVDITKKDEAPQPVGKP